MERSRVITTAANIFFETPGRWALFTLETLVANGLAAAAWINKEALGVSVNPLCLCGEFSPGYFHQRDTEDAQRHGEIAERQNEAGF